MNRRGFFGLVAASAAVVVAPELAELLVPRRTIFLPPAGGWLSSRGLLRYTEFYDFQRDQLVGRHDVLIAGEQCGVDQIITLDNTPEQARKMAWLLLGNTLAHRGLALADMQRVPIAIMAGDHCQSQYV
jgi:hypothetical protein